MRSYEDSCCLFFCIQKDNPKKPVAFHAAGFFFLAMRVSYPDIQRADYALSLNSTPVSQWWGKGIMHYTESKFYRITKSVKKKYSLWKGHGYVPFNFLHTVDFNHGSEAMRLFLSARLEAADRAGYFTVNDIRRYFPNARTMYRILLQCTQIGYIVKIAQGRYKIISVKKQGCIKRRGGEELYLHALLSKANFRNWLVAGAAAYMISQGRKSYDRLAKYKRADKRVSKINELLNSPRGEWKDKERRSTRSRLQEYETNEYKNLPDQLTKLCYQYLDAEKPNVGYVSNQMISDFFGISLTRASRYRWYGHKQGFHKVELQAVEISAFEAANAPYLEKFFKGRVFTKDGKWFIRMTSKITSKVRIHSNKVKSYNIL